MRIRTSLFAAFLLPLSAHAQPARVDVASGPLPIRILAQSPAETATELQVICLFPSSAANALNGSLAEIDEKLKGLLSRVRTPELFRGEWGETLLIAPPPGSLAAKRLLIIGLGDSVSFTPQRMQLVGEILYAEASRLIAAHPFFAPTILDGGVNKFTTGEVAEQVIRGFLRAASIQKLLAGSGASSDSRVVDLTYLAGAKNVASTREGIEKAIAAPEK